MNNRAGIITIGDEILIGQIINTNVAWLGEQLSLAGLDVIKTWTIGDNHELIVATLQEALSQTDTLFITGGLGPTKDDVTKKALAAFLHVPLFFHQPTFERIQRIFEKSGRVLSPSHHDQCLMPEGVQILHNRMGTAPGMLFTKEGKRIISMPGVPVEMKAIMEDEVLPEIRANSTLEIAHFTILTSGEGETTIENQIRDIVQALPENISVAYLPALGQVRLRITGKDKIGSQITQKVKDISQQISQRLGNLVYGYNTSSLEAELIQTCRKYNLSICTAESCTGGAVAAKIVSIPGASDVFAGGLVCYSNQLKTSLLGVPAELLAQYGAVSEETVIAMMKGAIIKLGVSAAVAISGIAGPDGGSAEKPVGTIWICIGNGNSFITHQLRAGKDRKSNIELAVTTSLRIFRKWILETYR